MYKKKLYCLLSTDNKFIILKVLLFVFFENSKMLTKRECVDLQDVTVVKKSIFIKKLFPRLLKITIFWNLF